MRQEKKGKAGKISLLVVSAFFLLLSIFGMFNFYAQGKRAFSDYVINIVVAVVAAILLLVACLMLKGKIKPIKLPKMRLVNLGGILLMLCQSGFFLGLLIHFAIEGEVGLMLIAIFFLLAIWVGMGTWILSSRHKAPIRNDGYAETLVRRPLNKQEPVTIQENKIFLDSQSFFAWRKTQGATAQYEKYSVIALQGKEPEIQLIDDGQKTRTYRLQTEGEENFDGKYFLVSVRMAVRGTPPVPMVQIDGFISDTQKDRKMTLQDVGYRMEGYFLRAGEASAAYYGRMCGRDLPAKALKYLGYTTPSNVRLVGICPRCGKSFCFRGYSFYMAQSDVAYSDDGLDCCEITCRPDLDKDSWCYEADGKTFRYYNSFCCPHCGTPYIDYARNREDKVFGVSGCVHLGRKPYRSE